MLLYINSPFYFPFFPLAIPNCGNARLVFLSKAGLCSWFVFQSLLDDQGLAEVSQIAEEVMDAVNKGLYKEATQLWGQAEVIIEQVTGHALRPAQLVGFFPQMKGPWLVVSGSGVYPETPQYHAK